MIRRTMSEKCADSHSAARGLSSRGNPRDLANRWCPGSPGVPRDDTARHRTMQSVIMAFAALVAVAAPLPLCVAAPPPAPAPAPTTLASGATTRPAASPALDQSSPKALLRSFFLSRGEVDETALRSLFYAANLTEQKILDGVIQVELANARLRAAEQQKFGHATTAPSSPGASQLDPQSAADIDMFVEKIAGDHATVAPAKDAAMSMELVRVDGKWKLPIASLAGRAVGPGAADSIRAATKAQIEVIDGLAADVRSGKLTSEDQVRQEMDRRFAERLAAAVKGTVPPASSSATQPSTVPKLSTRS